MPSSPEVKRRALCDELASLERVIVAYSGGVDSTFLAAVAHEVLGDAAHAVTAVSPSLARRDLDEGRRIAAERGWNHREVRTREVARDDYARNDDQRCYWCKTELFEVLGSIAGQMNAAIAVGTNADDVHDYRPGIRAASEHGIRAPLLSAELGKDEIRRLSRSLGLPTADKPSSPCLASRFAYGVRVTPAGLRRVERAEEIVAGLGFRIVRVRDRGGHATVEVASEELPRALELQERINAELVALGYSRATVDERGYRRGSLNEALPLLSFGAPRSG